MNRLYHISSGPHTRGRLNTSRIMFDVVIAMMPAVVAGIWTFGIRAFWIILAAVLSAVITEYIFCLVTRRPNSVRDGSAVVTGLMLALLLSPTVPLYIPIMGSVFAILVVKCFFGGLGKNFMNPALAGRCFLLISFGSAMTNYKHLDAVSSATPLEDLMAGRTINLTDMFLGRTSGVIGCSILALLIGALYLLVIEAIQWEIPAATLVVFVLFIGLFDKHGFDPMYLLAHVIGGGIVMGAFFMATDPVTSPATKQGQIIYGALIGLLAGIFRVYGSSADSVSYAIIIANLVTPMIDQYIVPKPYGFRAGAQMGEDGAPGFSFKLYRPALNLTIITLVAGLGLAAVYNMTKNTIDEQKRQAKLMSYQAVLPEAEVLETDEKLDEAVAKLGGGVFGTSYGKVRIREAVVGKDAGGNVIGHVVSVTSSDGFDGDITLSLGVKEDGSISAIEFTELNETAGMGMRCAEPAFKDQFAGVNVEEFVLNKAGGSTQDNEIDSVSGASISSGAVVNAVNAGLAFLRENAM